MGDLKNQLGLIELILFESIVLLIAGYQLWSVRKSLRESREKKRRLANHLPAETPNLPNQDQSSQDPSS